MRSPSPSSPKQSVSDIGHSLVHHRWKWPKIMLWLSYVENKRCFVCVCLHSCCSHFLTVIAFPIFFSAGIQCALCSLHAYYWGYFWNLVRFSNMHLDQGHSSWCHLNKHCKSRIVMSITTLDRKEIIEVCINQVNIYPYANQNWVNTFQG